MPGIVEQVRDGSTFRVELLLPSASADAASRQHVMIVLHLAGLQCPRCPLPLAVLQAQQAQVQYMAEQLNQISPSLSTQGKSFQHLFVSSPHISKHSSRVSATFLLYCFRSQAWSILLNRLMYSPPVGSNPSDDFLFHSCPSLTPPPSPSPLQLLADDPSARIEPVKEEPAAPFATEARLFAENRLLHRDVGVRIELRTVAS